ncbi:MAG: tandem-95 repeat protein [Sphingomonadales bacterium]|nr:tandem-95 repeat protein [Sphingomonadales bacterium]
MTYSAAEPLHGSITVGNNGQLTYTPDNGYTGADSVVVTVSDGRGGSATQTYAVTVNAGNSAPVIAATGLSFSTILNASKPFIVDATDPNGDNLTYSAADPTHGTVSGGTNGQFVYTPDNGFTGTDSFTVTVSDGRGGTDVETFTATVLANSLPSQRLFSLLASGGFTGSVGGYGNIFGTSGSEEITALDRPGALTLDPSFNKGGDVIRLSGDAGDWQIFRSGSTAILSDGDTFLEIPTGTSGMAIVFDDGARVLRIDTQIGSLTIGSQAFGEQSVQIAAPAQSVTPPTGLSPEAFASVLLQADGEISAGGVLNLFGTASGNETVDLISGDIDFDPSFNKGGDLVVLNTPAENFQAKVAGSAVLLTSDDLNVTIPAGIVGIDIEFDTGDQRMMYIDRDVGLIVLGSQQIGIDPIVLAAVV